jgi:hypothetical protein
MIVKSLNLQAPNGNLWKLSVSADTGTTITGIVSTTRNTGRDATGLPYIQVDGTSFVTVNNDGSLIVQDYEFVSGPRTGPIWFYDDTRPVANTYSVIAGAGASGPIPIAVKAQYYRQAGTPFFIIYNRFLSKITDDLYLEWTLDDTYKNLEAILLDAIPQFEWPKFGLYMFNTQVVGMVDHDGSVVSYGKYMVDLTLEEIDIISNIMAVEWLSRQILTVNLTRMKFSTADFKFTSQANHLQTLIKAKEHFLQQNKKMQRLYRRRNVDSNGRVSTNYYGLASSSIIERWRLLRLGAEWLYGSPFNGGTWWNEELNNMYGVYFGGILPGIPSGVMPYEQTDTVFPQVPPPAIPNQ